MRHHFNRKYISYIKFPLLFCAAFFIGAAAGKIVSYQKEKAVPSASESSGWGLSFQEEGKRPVGNASIEELKKYDSADIYIIGGESIYNQFVDECDVAHITKVDYAYDADAHFPNLDEKPEWEITQDSEEQTYFDLIFYYYKYEKKHN